MSIAPKLPASPVYSPIRGLKAYLPWTPVAQLHAAYLDPKISPSPAQPKNRKPNPVLSQDISDQGSGDLNHDYPDMPVDSSIKFTPASLSFTVTLCIIDTQRQSSCYLKVEKFHLSESRELQTHHDKPNRTHLRTIPGSIHSRQPHQYCSLQG